MPWKGISDFVIDNPMVLPSDARIAVIGDWGTGQDQALAVLKSLAAKKPHVVIHLGDVYYAWTEPEQSITSSTTGQISCNFLPTQLRG